MILPLGTRLVLVSDNLLDLIGTRSGDGRRLSFEWGEQRPGGWYEPTITATDDGMAVVPRTLLVALDALWEAAWVLAEEVHDERGERNPEHDSPLFRECSAESCVLNRAALAAAKEATDA